MAAIATELRRRWHFDSLSMISASPAGAITRNSFNPYLKTNNNFRWSLRTLTKGSTLISTYYHAKSLIRVCSELCSSRTWWPVAPCFCYWETGKTDYTWGTLDFRGSEHRAQSKALTLSLLLIKQQAQCQGLALSPMLWSSEIQGASCIICLPSFPIAKARCHRPSGPTRAQQICKVWWLQILEPSQGGSLTRNSDGDWSKGQNFYCMLSDWNFNGVNRRAHNNKLPWSELYFGNKLFANA